MTAGSFFEIHMRYVVLMSLWPSTIKHFDFKLTSDAKNSASYLKMQAGKTDAFHFSHHSHSLVTLHVQFLCYDWSKFDR